MSVDILKGMVSVLENIVYSSLLKRKNKLEHLASIMTFIKITFEKMMCCCCCLYTAQNYSVECGSTWCWNTKQYGANTRNCFSLSPMQRKIKSVFVGTMTLSKMTFSKMMRCCLAFNSFAKCSSTYYLVLKHQKYGAIAGKTNLCS